MTNRDEAVMARLNDQIQWYDHRSRRNQLWYRSLKIASMAATGLVPVAAGFGFSASVAGALGFFALLCEGLQQMNQYHANWISFRSTCEALKHEKHLFAAQAGHYRDVADPVILLAEQIEALVSVEHAKWVSTRRESEKAATS